MVSRAHWKGNYRFDIRKDFPPSVIPGTAIYEFMACTRLDQAAVLETVYTNPSRGIGRFRGWFYIWNDPFTGNAVKSPLFPVIVYPLQFVEDQPKPEL